MKIKPMKQVIPFPTGEARITPKDLCATIPRTDKE